MNNKILNNLGKMFYNNINLIQDYNIDDLLKYKHSGITSLVLKFYINKKDKIDYIINKDINFMKRDYLIIILYYYDIDYNKAINLFESKVYNNLQNTDLDFILDNKLYKLLDIMDGLWLSTSYRLISTNLLTDNNLLKMYYLNDKIIEDILLTIELQLSRIIVINLNNFWNKNYNKFNIIIDGGNIIHHIKGNADLTNLDKLNNDNSLIIIHKKHNYNQHNKLCYITPYNYYDDLFILWFFFKSKCTYSIITNDKFKDHKLNNILNIDNYINQKIINYDLINNTINTNNIYSKCIQQIDSTTYAIPTIYNEFILLKI